MKRFLRIRAENSHRVAALALSAALMLVPANLLPVISMHSLGQDRTDTIFSGILELWRQGYWGIALIVFIASLVIPILKLVGLGSLLLAVYRNQGRHARRLTRLYATLDFIGRWSMLDVFLVAFLAGVVRFGALATVQPRSGIVAFACAVLLTVLATDAFDPRLLWRHPSSEAAPPTLT